MNLRFFFFKYFLDRNVLYIPFVRELSLSSHGRFPIISHIAFWHVRRNAFAEHKIVIYEDE